MITSEVKKQMISFCHRMDSKGWVANHDGNITQRLADGFAATPTAKSKGLLRADELLELDSTGKKVISGGGKPFSELAIHLRVYHLRKDVNAVIHAHSPSATAVGCANQEMLTWSLPEAIVSLGPGVPLVGLDLPLTEKFFSEFDALVPHYDAVMIAGNGVFSWGKDLEQAFLRMELVEHLSNILLKSLSLGGPKMLSSEQVSTLLKKRASSGLALPPDPHRPDWFPQ